MKLTYKRSICRFIVGLLSVQVFTTINSAFCIPFTPKIVPLVTVPPFDPPALSPQCKLDIAVDGNCENQFLKIAIKDCYVPAPTCDPNQTSQYEVLPTPWFSLYFDDNKIVDQSLNQMFPVGTTSGTIDIPLPENVSGLHRIKALLHANVQDLSRNWVTTTIPAYTQTIYCPDVQLGSSNQIYLAYGDIKGGVIVESLPYRQITRLAPLFSPPGGTAALRVETALLNDKRYSSGIPTLAVAASPYPGLDQYYYKPPATVQILRFETSTLLKTITPGGSSYSGEIHIAGMSVGAVSALVVAINNPTPKVIIYDIGTGLSLKTFTAYTDQIPIQIAVGNVLGDSAEEIVTVPYSDTVSSANSKGLLQVFKADGTRVASFYPFAGYTGKLHVGTNINNPSTSYAQIVVSTIPQKRGDIPQTKIFAFINGSFKEVSSYTLVDEFWSSNRASLLDTNGLGLIIFRSGRSPYYNLKSQPFISIVKRSGTETIFSESINFLGDGSNRLAPYLEDLAAGADYNVSVYSGR